MSEVEQYQRAKNIFLHAIEVKPHERDAFLSKACGSDAELRREVEQLLRFHEDEAVSGQSSADGRQPMADSPRKNETQTSPMSHDEISRAIHEASDLPKDIGGYRIIREIGRGGMGNVYLGVREDGTFRRFVAVKVVKRGMDSDEILKRFELERQVLSALNHPNIARLYDAGQTDDGLPYFTMEYIKGLPIDEYCDRRRLTIAERLQLFQHVCSGVQHAHRNLVVHRDIKPSNIIVTEEGVPKLLDFGIAKLLNPELAMFSGDPTAPELRVMTPEYASPEQVRGEMITTASDVYSLGVLLYEMLTGHRPYHLKTRLRAEIERVICEQEPERPSTAISHAEEIITRSTTDGKGTKSITPETVSRSRSARLDQLRRQLAGDLDNIVLMAMRKETQRRYTSVERLMEDIDRHRLGHPVSARPSSIGYRAAKFVKRNRVGVAMASLVLLTVIGGLAVGLLFQAAAASEARAAQAEARQEQMATQLELEQARADQREAEAERRAQNVRNLVQFFLGDFHDAVLRLDHSMEVRQLVVQNGLTFLEELAQEPGAEDDLRLQRELARAYERIGDVQGGVRGQRIGDFDGALESYQKALSIRERLLENVPDDPELRRELITSLIRVSDALDQLRRYEEVLPHFERIFVMLEQFADNDPDRVGSSRLMMIALNTLGRTFSRLEQDDDALEMNLRAYEIAQELYALNPDDDRYARDLGVSEINLADRYAVRGEQELALRHAFQGLEIRSTMAERNPENTTYRFDVAVAHRAATAPLIELARVEEATDHFAAARELIVDLIQKNPADERNRRFLGVMFAEADEFFQSGSKWADALRNSVESLAAYRFLIELEPDSMEYLLRAATVQMAGARAMAGLDRVDDAAAEYAEILESLLRLELREQSNEEVAATLAQCFLDYGRLQLEMELLPSARAYLTESARRHARLAELHPDADDFRDRLIETHLYLADHAALRDDAADALTHSQRSLELSAERSPQVLLRLGTALRLNERYDEAAAILREAIDAISDDPDSSPEVRDAIARELQLLRDRRE